jgi:hypothetical protein
MHDNGSFGFRGCGNLRGCDILHDRGVRTAGSDASAKNQHCQNKGDFLNEMIFHMFLLKIELCYERRLRRSFVTNTFQDWKRFHYFKNYF